MRRFFIRLRIFHIFFIFRLSALSKRALSVLPLRIVMQKYRERAHPSARAAAQNPLVRMGEVHDDLQKE
jgi:hypothetical protein